MAGNLTRQAKQRLAACLLVIFVAIASVGGHDAYERHKLEKRVTVLEQRR